MAKRIIVITLIALGVLAYWSVLGFSIYRCCDAVISDKCDYSADMYNEMASNTDVMPKTDEIGKYTGIYTQSFRKNDLFFISTSYTLIAKYDEKEYNAQKKKVNSSYTFYDDMIENEYVYFKIDPNFEIDGFSFRTLIDSNADYPHHMYFVGLNDSKKEIAYINFIDTDLDYIGGGLDDFVEEYCGWDIGKIDEKCG